MNNNKTRVVCLSRDTNIRQFNQWEDHCVRIILFVTSHCMNLIRNTNQDLRYEFKINNGDAKKKKRISNHANYCFIMFTL